ncbi:MAG: hypothetical protein M3228_13195 [Actinomycetota bacterium]|nr:hypothetical protein [Actinomycetota bacterium]
MRTGRSNTTASAKRQPGPLWQELDRAGERLGISWTEERASLVHLVGGERRRLAEFAGGAEQCSLPV